MKSWDIFYAVQFQNASKEVFWLKFFLNFMHMFKSAILAIFLFYQDGTFELLHEIPKKFWPKDFFWGIRKIPCTNSIHNFFQGPPNRGFRSVKVQTETFFKKNSRNFKNSLYLGLLWIQAWKAKLEVALFLVVHNCKKTQCELVQLNVVIVKGYFTYKYSRLQTQMHKIHQKPHLYLNTLPYSMKNSVNPNNTGLAVISKINIPTFLWQSIFLCFLLFFCKKK